ncbi:hypothetical protein I4F81_005724 [Pyropia yezoensis]|uniref:Uncharacterized protein n=1 Tax=Pyropia yezoensis TaxID=2788 RepID=A0ACC3BZ16_PYRYE|nr:hypothetical protein I4F81_005724 [Neopyropia yezoensis]
MAAGETWSEPTKLHELSCHNVFLRGGADAALSASSGTINASPSGAASPFAPAAEIQPLLPSVQKAGSRQQITVGTLWALHVGGPRRDRVVPLCPPS